MDLACKHHLGDKIRHLEANGGHKLTLLESLTCEVEWKGSRLTQKQLVVVQSDKEFGLLGRDLHSRAPICCQGLQSSCEADTRNTVNILQSQKNTSTSSRQGHREAGTNGQTGHPGTSTARRSY